VPKQNRVTPFGDLIATPERGTFMGSRGILHDDKRRIRRAWQVKRWLVCVLEFRGRKRTVMTPGHYTELFFLDEATGLAAGHRPCAECRHPRFIAFCNAWRTANPGDGRSSRPTANVIDDCLHADRIASGRSKRSFMGSLELPDGVVVTVGAWGEQAYLVWGDLLLAWSPRGYGERRRRPKGEEVRVLTPKSTVGTIRAGYVPDIHPSALAIAIMTPAVFCQRTVVDRGGEGMAVGKERTMTRQGSSGRKKPGKPSVRRDMARLEDIPNIGPAVAADLRQLGIRSPGELLGRDPYAMYDDLCRITGLRHDPCLLDTFIAAVRYMAGEPKKHWWKFTAERKREMEARTSPKK
jgi:hypothetical protein